MPMDLYRVDDHYVVAFDLPGVDPGSIDLNVDGNTLSIRAERPSLRSEEGVQWLAQERPVGSHLRQLNLGDGLDVERIQASYDAGVLTVTIPVAEKARPRRITVETGLGAASRSGYRLLHGPVDGERPPPRAGRGDHELTAPAGAKAPDPGRVRALAVPGRTRRRGVDEDTPGVADGALRAGEDAVESPPCRSRSCTRPPWSSWSWSRSDRRPGRPPAARAPRRRTSAFPAAQTAPVAEPPRPVG